MLFANWSCCLATVPPQKVRTIRILRFSEFQFLLAPGHNDLVETDMRAYFGEVCG